MEEEEEEEPVADTTQEAGGAGKRRAKRKKKQKSKDGGGAAAAGDDEGGAPMRGHALQPVAEEDWVDITGVCSLAAQGMHLGEMLESPQFRLVDAISAVEIMDPKMDSGFNSGADMTLERAEAEGVLSASLGHDEMVAIWDRMLMLYLLWLDGHTIVQTVFSCLYLQDPPRHAAPMPVFGAFVDAYLATCRAARAALMHANIFDDEDFLPGMFGIDLDARAAFSTKPSEIFDSLARHRKAVGGKDAASCRAARRLEFIGEYMMALTALARSDDKARAAARRHTEACLRVVREMRAELEAGGADDSAAALRCFDASFNRKLVPGPPRTVAPIEDRGEVLKRLTSHLGELLLSTDALELPLARLLNGAIPGSEPNVLPRSVAHAAVQSRSGHFRRLLLDSLEACLFPPDAMVHCKKAAEAFVSRCDSLLGHLLRLASGSRARRFRRLAHYFGDFNSLQHEAWRLDEELQKTFASNLRFQRPCWVWVMEQCLTAMIAKLLLGFELDIYDEAEFHMIYWYVDYLFGLRIYNAVDLCNAKEQGSTAKKRSAAAREKAAGPRAQRPRNPPASLLLLEATQAVTRGLFRLLAFCQRQALTSAPAGASTGLAQRFVLRFRSLERFRLPHLPSFQDFELSSASAKGPVEGRAVLDAAKASFADASASLERVSGIQEDHAAAEEAGVLARVVAENLLAVEELTRMLNEGTSRKVVATASHHPHFVSVDVQRGPEHGAPPL